MKKVYSPGELAYRAYFPESTHWEIESANVKKYFVETEKNFFDMIAEQAKADEVDEQTDDSCGIVTL